MIELKQYANTLVTEVTFGGGLLVISDTTPDRKISIKFLALKNIKDLRESVSEEEVEEIIENDVDKTKSGLELIFPDSKVLNHFIENLCIVRNNYNLVIKNDEEIKILF